MAVDDVLLLYGETRRLALRAYRSAMASMDGEEWSGAAPGELPWWRLGRPTEEERLRRRGGKMPLSTSWDGAPRNGDRVHAKEWLEVTCAHPECDPQELRGPRAGAGSREDAGADRPGGNRALWGQR